MSVLNTERLNQIIRHLQTVYSTYNLPAQPLYLSVSYTNQVFGDLTESDTSTMGDWPIRQVEVTAHVHLDPDLYSTMLDQPAVQLCDAKLEIKHTSSVGDAITSLRIYCPVDPADLTLLESMGVAKKEYTSFSTYSHTCSLP